MKDTHCDVAIIGAGPAGATLSLLLAEAGLQVTVIEKDRFPRSKVCGDALSGQVLSVLKRIPGTLYNEFLQLNPLTPSAGIRFTAPDGSSTDLSFSPGRDHPENPSGFICPRDVFDDFLARKIKESSSISYMEGRKVNRVALEEQRVRISGDGLDLTARMVAGADGVNSVTRSLLPEGPSGHRYYCTGIRAYYRGIRDLHPKQYIELFFLKELLPFYFWIFPETGGVSNVGLAIRNDRIRKDGLRPVRVLNHIIRDIPYFADRFRDAQMEGAPGAHLLPFQKGPGRSSGDRFLLLGDAASLVDPFTGEGIGNAMASAEVAARVILAAAARDDFSAKFLSDYEVQLERRIGKELRTSRILQRLSKSSWLFSRIVRKASSDPAFHKILQAAFRNEDKRARMVRPGMILRILLGGSSFSFNSRNSEW